MFPPLTFNRARTATLLGGLLLLATRGAAQDFTLRVTGADRALRDGILPDSLDRLFDPRGEGFKGGLYAALGVDVTYNSNLFLTESDEQDEWIFGITPSLYYTTDPEGGARCLVTAYYTPTQQIYCHNSDFNRFNNALGGSVVFTGSRTEVAVFADYYEYSGSDRFSGGFIEGSAVRYGVRGSYQLAPRTQLHASVTGATSDYEEAGQSGSDSYVATLGARWAATERLRFGPTLRLSSSEGSTTGTREAVALLFDASYLWTDRIDVSLAVGPDFYEYSRPGGGDGVDLYIDFAANYVINERWTWRSGIHYGAVPSPTEMNTAVTDYGITTSLVRQLLHGSIEGGARYHISDYEQAVEAVGDTVQDEDFYELFLTYRRSLWRERVDLHASVIYGSNDGQQDWSQWQVIVGLQARF